MQESRVKPAKPVLCICRFIYIYLILFDRKIVDTHVYASI